MWGRMHASRETQRSSWGHSRESDAPSLGRYNRTPAPIQRKPEPSAVDAAAPPCSQCGKGIVGASSSRFLQRKSMPSPPEVEEQPSNETTAPCPACAATIQRKVEGQAKAPPAGFDTFLESSSAGDPLPGAVKAGMEGRLGEDFSDVRVHTDKSAHRAARAIRAHAFTTGYDIYFGEGEYDPSSSSGKKLIAHELTHVAQQREGRVEPRSSAVVAGSTDALEIEADRVADGQHISREVPVKSTAANASRATIQRQIGDGHDLSGPLFANDPVLESVYDGHYFVKKSDQGAHVRKIQYALEGAGYILRNFGVDGIFGEETSGMVRKYQFDHALAFDGIVGPQTVEALDQQNQSSAPIPDSPSSTVAIVGNNRVELGKSVQLTVIGLLENDEAVWELYHEGDGDASFMDADGNFVVTTDEHRVAVQGIAVSNPQDDIRVRVTTSRGEAERSLSVDCYSLGYTALSTGTHIYVRKGSLCQDCPVEPGANPTPSGDFCIREQGATQTSGHEAWFLIEPLFESSRSRMHLHPGQFSLGCQTVTDRPCFDKVAEILKLPGDEFSTFGYDGCPPGNSDCTNWWGGQRVDGPKAVECIGKLHVGN